MSRRQIVAVSRAHRVGPYALARLRRAEGYAILDTRTGRLLTVQNPHTGRPMAATFQTVRAALGAAQEATR